SLTLASVRPHPERLRTLRAPASPAQSVLGGGTEERAAGARRRSAGESEGASAPSLKNRQSPPPRHYSLPPLFCQSSRNFLSPMSVSGCLISCWSTLNGMVATWAPALAASITCSGLRMDAASTCVLKPCTR